jgi:hypothetical protein
LRAWCAWPQPSRWLGRPGPCRRQPRRRSLARRPRRSASPACAAMSVKQVNRNGLASIVLRRVAGRHRPGAPAKHHPITAVGVPPARPNRQTRARCLRGIRSSARLAGIVARPQPAGAARWLAFVRTHDQRTLAPFVNACFPELSSVHQRPCLSLSLHPISQPKLASAQGNLHWAGSRQSPLLPPDGGAARLASLHVPGLASPAPSPAPGCARCYDSV